MAGAPVYPNPGRRRKSPGGGTRNGCGCGEAEAVVLWQHGWTRMPLRGSGMDGDEGKT